MSEENSTRLGRLMEKLGAEDLAAEGDFISEMTKAIKEPPKRVPEYVFREIFLPAFAGTDPEVSKKSGDFIAHWVGVVGSPTESAEVVDHVGNVLFNVPPIYDSSLLNTTKAERPSMSYSSILTNLSETSKVNPQAAWGEFAHKTTERLDSSLSAQSDSNPTVQGWSKIFEYYGIVPAKAKEESTAPNTQGDLNDDFVF